MRLMTLAAAVSLGLLVSTSAFGQALALDPAEVPANNVAGGATACAGGEIYDDGGAENGYSGNPATVTTVEVVQQFTPAAYPATYTTACVALVSLGGATLDFEIEVRDDDGAGGTPGTLLGTVPVSVSDLPAGLPCQFYTVDISSLNLNIASGSVFIGTRHSPMAFPSRFVCADESDTTPLHPGFVNFNLGDGFVATQTVFPAYNAHMIRAISAVIAADLQTSIVASPSTVAPGLPISYAASVVNNGPGDAQNVQLTVALGAGVGFSSVTASAGGSCTTPAFGANGSVVCSWAGATASGTTRSATVNAFSYTLGQASATASATSESPDPTPGNNSASGSVTIAVGGGITPPAFIPTASHYGLAFLAVLMGLLGFAAVRRQH